MHGCMALLAFLELPLALQSIFANLPPFRKSISKPGGDFAAWRSFGSQGAFSQTISKLKNHFVAILKLGDHFIAIWKFENHLVAKGHFRSTWRIWQGVAMGLRNHFAAGCHFRSPFRSCKMGLGGCEMALVCQRGVSQLRNTLRNGALAAKFSLVLCAFVFKRP